jgi:MFS superfamily sulfate permease-like transporter
MAMNVTLARDLPAGLTLAAVAIPEQMATARLGHFSPEIGFLAFIAGTLGFALLGQNRYVSVGADSTITPIFAGSLALFAAAGSPEYASLAALLALMVGVAVTVAGLCRMGWISSLLSAPVTSGFLAGISVHIIASQLPTLCQISSTAESPVGRLASVASQIGHANFLAIAIGLGVLATIAGFEKWYARWPGALIGVAGAGILTWLLGWQQHGVAVLGAMAAPMPHVFLSVPALGDVARLAPLALLISMVVIIQTAATTQSFPPASDAEPDIGRDFIGAGTGSILAGLVGAFPVNASPPRTAVTVEAGAQSRAAGLAAALAVGVLAAFGSGLLRHVPNAALAGVLLFVALRILRVRMAILLWNESKVEFCFLLATAIAIIALPIQTGVALGIALSLGHGIWTTTRTRVIALGRVPGTSIWWPHGTSGSASTDATTLVLAFQAPLSFLNADSFRRGFLQAIAKAPNPVRLVVFEASSVVEIDFTAAHVLEDVIRHCRSAGMQFAIARLESVRAQQSLQCFGILDLLGGGDVYHSVYEAVAALNPDDAANGSAPAAER